MRKWIGYFIDAGITAGVVSYGAEELLTGDIERGVIILLIGALRIRFVLAESAIRRNYVAIAEIEARDAQRDLL